MKVVRCEPTSVRVTSSHHFHIFLQGCDIHVDNSQGLNEPHTHYRQHEVVSLRLVKAGALSDDI